MSVLRATVPILAALAVVAGPSASAPAQGGAGDDQYQDPFANTPAKTRPAAKTLAKTQPRSGGSTTPGSGSGAAPSLSQAPPVPLPGSAPSPSGAAPATTPGTGNATSGAAAGQLPNTGLDLNGIALLGLGLLLTGAGLRLRTADARDF